RAGLAWSLNPGSGLARKLLGDGRTVFRGGFGIAYDGFAWFYGGGYLSNYPRAQSFQIDAPETVELFSQVIVKPAKGLDPLVAFSNLPEDAQLPTTHSYSFSIQRQFGRDYVAEIGYAGNRNYHLEFQTERNPAVLTPAQASAVIAARNANQIPSAQQRRVNPAWGSRTVYETSATGRYNALFGRIDKRLS